MKQADNDLAWAHIWRYAPNNKRLYNTMAEEGIFWHMGIDKGRFQLAAFGTKTGRLSGVQHNYSLGWDKGNFSSIHVRKPGAYYMGSYRYIHVPSKSIREVDGFRLERMQSMSERKLLEKLLTILKKDYAKYTHQIALLDKRLRRLRGRKQG